TSLAGRAASPEVRGEVDHQVAKRLVRGGITSLVHVGGRTVRPPTSIRARRHERRYLPLLPPVLDPCHRATSNASGTSASSPTSTRARPPSPSASSSTRGRSTRW